MNEFISLVKSEHSKVKRNRGVWAFILLPFVLTMLNNLYIIYNSASLDEINVNPWKYLLGRYLLLSYSLIYPLVTCIFTYSLFDLEHGNSNFKGLFVLPVKKTKIFYAKVFYICEIVTISVLAAYVLFLLSGFLFASLFPRYAFQDYDARVIIGLFFLKLYLACLAVSSLNYFLSLLFKNFVMSLGIGCLGVVFSLVATQWKYIHIVPYHYPYQSYIDFIKEDTTLMNIDAIACIVYFFLFIGFSYLLFKRMKV